MSEAKSGCNGWVDVRSHSLRSRRRFARAGYLLLTCLVPTRSSNTGLLRAPGAAATRRAATVLASPTISTQGLARVRIGFASAILSAAVSSAWSAEFDLKSSYASQFVSVTNKTGVVVPAIRVECGFFRGDEFLVLGIGIATKIEAGQTAFVEVLANNAALATKTECRIVTP
jgi:hypothetical protein